ncbi:MAG: cell division protein FtsQ/DivIB [Firmicutes bacterium]|nr:cell division protein FtsQ/DivIB [Bacillota bacterium]
MRGEGDSRVRKGMAGIVLLALLGLGLLAGYAALYTGYFRYQGLELVGASRITPAEVEQILGLRKGEPRWRYPVAVLRRELLRLEPWVKEAEVTWQGGLLRIAVTERRPVALLPYYNLYAVLDAEGVVLDAATLDEYRLPVISGISLPRALRGERVQHPDLAGALRAAALLPREVADQVSEIHVTPLGELELILEGPVTVFLGPPQRLEEKLATLPAVWEDGLPLLEVARRQGYDLNLVNPDRPTFQPWSSGR